MKPEEILELCELLEDIRAHAEVTEDAINIAVNLPPGYKEKVNRARVLFHKMTGTEPHEPTLN